jgi:hypothetical protein
MSKLGNFGLRKIGKKEEETKPQPKQVTNNAKPSVIPLDVTKAKQFFNDPCGRPC